MFDFLKTPEWQKYRDLIPVNGWYYWLNGRESCRVHYVDSTGCCIYNGAGPGYCMRYRMCFRKKGIAGGVLPGGKVTLKGITFTVLNNDLLFMDGIVRPDKFPMVDTDYLPFGKTNSWKSSYAKQICDKATEYFSI